MQIPDEQTPNIIRAVEHYAAYLKATKRDDRPYLELAQSLVPKPNGQQRVVRTVKRRRVSPQKLQPTQRRK